MYDAAPPEPSIELPGPQARRVIARRTSLLGDTLRSHPASLGSSQSPPTLQSSVTLTTPPRLHSSTNDDIYLVPSSQGVHPTASTSFADVKPLQNHAHSHYRSHQTYDNQQSPADENQTKPVTQTSVVLRTTTLAPSSPLLQSTVTISRASQAVSHHYPQSQYQIQADPNSPYYTFQDTRLIPNPIIRIYMANNANPKMFSLQNISPDTLSLLLSVFVSCRMFVPGT